MGLGTSPQINIEGVCPLFICMPLSQRSHTASCGRWVMGIKISVDSFAFLCYSLDGGGNMSVLRSRHWFGVTYLSREQVMSVMDKHSCQLRAWAAILHDSDEGKEPHIHILISLFNNTTESGITSWFRGFTDSNGLIINTFFQACFDRFSCFGYLTHKDNLDKFQYSSDLIFGYALDFYQDDTILSDDALTLALDDMLSGLPLSMIYRRYGRDFIVHYGHIKALYEDIKKEL